MTTLAWFLLGWAVFASAAAAVLAGLASLNHERSRDLADHLVNRYGTRIEVGRRD